MAFRIGVSIATGVLALAAAVAAPPAAADPGEVLPPLASTGGGPIIGGGDEAAQNRIMMQLTNIGPADVPQADGADAASFIMDSAGLTDPRFSSPFVPLRRALGCQKDNTSFGARAYRRADGQWGGAALVIAKSATADLEALTSCVKSIWPGSTVGGMCANGWTYPTSGENHRPETYYILLAGTSGDFCGAFNANYANYATPWP
ncbi:hypothetical protein [Mycobacterium asiaticum]|uniref:Secreted protein n=1 Tax=Mycobacterium asiaticum TaxID=1790 RepID=A0A1A3MPL7_MYCAS|nr:hypothetical protein [Mycobacterium asiaticum]OBK11005.1 hypothetical protein A5636_14675 [Mycobacterium asiaticum]